MSPFQIRRSASVEKRPRPRRRLDQAMLDESYAAEAQPRQIRRLSRHHADVGAVTGLLPSGNDDGRGLTGMTDGEIVDHWARLQFTDIG
ncbi:hypothetical protein [Streptomyces sp. NPDC048581]|uniref:hypothetical protein n=1 Tax=unclassified Streptomyces TaxID=2593676 RepID=UPI00371C6C7C